MKKQAQTNQLQAEIKLLITSFEYFWPSLYLWMLLIIIIQVYIVLLSIRQLGTSSGWAICKCSVVAMGETTSNCMYCSAVSSVGCCSLDFPLYLLVRLSWVLLDLMCTSGLDTTHLMDALCYEPEERSLYHVLSKLCQNCRVKCGSTCCPLIKQL